MQQLPEQALWCVAGCHLALLTAREAGARRAAFAPPREFYCSKPQFTPAGWTASTGTWL